MAAGALAGAPGLDAEWPLLSCFPRDALGVGLSLCSPAISAKRRRGLALLAEGDPATGVLFGLKRGLLPAADLARLVPRAAALLGLVTFLAALGVLPAGAGEVGLGAGPCLAGWTLVFLAAAAVALAASCASSVAAIVFSPFSKRLRTSKATAI